MAIDKEIFLVYSPFLFLEMEMFYYMVFYGIII